MNHTAGSIRRSRWLAIVLSAIVALGLGWGLQAQEDNAVPEWAEGYRFGAQVYVEACGSCHTALPPEVMPRETWRILLQSADHYGVQIEVLQEPFLPAAWKFLQDFSRPRRDDEQIPYRLKNSRFFNALHPDVEFVETVKPTGCLNCHPRANLGDFVRLANEWQ
ncbi:MAG: hypothetical protein AB4040_04330 [Synechococcus sp.]